MWYLLTPTTLISYTQHDHGYSFMILVEPYLHKQSSEPSVFISFFRLINRGSHDGSGYFRWIYHDIPFKISNYEGIMQGYGVGHIFFTPWFPGWAFQEWDEFTA